MICCAGRLKGSRKGAQGGGEHDLQGLRQGALRGGKAGGREVVVAQKLLQVNTIEMPALHWL